MTGDFIHCPIGDDALGRTGSGTRIPPGLDNVFFPVTEGQSPLGLPPGGLFWFRALCPLGWGPRSRAWSAVGHIVGIPLTSVERSGSGRHTPPAFPWITRPRRPTPPRRDGTWRAYPGVVHAGRSRVVCRASSAFTNGDPSMGINPPVVMSAGPRPNSRCSVKWEGDDALPLAPGIRCLVRLQWSIPG